MALGIVFLGAGLPLLIRRYRRARSTLDLLLEGEAVQGFIMGVRENPLVSINNRHPWTITYRFSVQGRELRGEATTLRTPGQELQSGQPVYVLYLESDRTQNAIYPPVMYLDHAVATPYRRGDAPNRVLTEEGA